MQAGERSCLLLSGYIEKLHYLERSNSFSTSKEFTFSGTGIWNKTHPGCLPLEVVQAHHTGKKHQGKCRTYWKGWNYP